MSGTSRSVVAQGTTLHAEFAATGVSVTSTTSAWVRAAGSWITAGAKVGMRVVSTDTTNTAERTITGVTATDLTVTPSLGADTLAASADFTFEVPVGEVTDFDGPGGSNSEIDVTHLGSTAREFRNGLTDSGEVSVSLNFVPGDVGQVFLRQKQAEKNTPTAFVLTLTDTPATTIRFNAFVREFNITGATDDKVSATATLRVTGPVTWGDIS